MAASCLETHAVSARQGLLAKSAYNGNNIYDETHRDAIADGDRHGRGTGQAAGQMWLPHCTSNINVFNYSNFATDSTRYLIGNSIDNRARTFAITHSLYNQAHQYDENTYTMESNALDGIYIGF